MSKEKFILTLPAEAENLSIIRLTTSAIAAKSNFTIDKIEDLKLCISEICNMAIKSENNQVFDIEYLLGEDDIEVCLKNLHIVPEKIKEYEISEMILKALIEDLKITEECVKLRLDV